MNKKTILLVEDNPDDADLALRALKKNNILNEITVVRDGKEALDYLKPAGEHDRKHLPSVVLLDLQLPKVGGMEVLRHIRSNDRTKFLPVIILSSSREEQDLINSYRLGANSYIQKPVDFEQFTEAVRQLGLYWLLLNEIPPITGRLS